MKAFILAGGLGTRLREVVADVPKPMAPVGGKPFLDYQIRWLKKSGINDIVLCVGHMKEVIKTYFGDGKHLGMSIVYSEEEDLLGTAGAIKLAERFADGTFLVLNGDTYAKVDFGKILAAHKANKSLATIGLVKVKDVSASGEVRTDAKGRVTSFCEKSGQGTGFINAGVYVFEPGIFDRIKPGMKLSLEKDIFPELVDEGLFAQVMDGYFIDMGLPDSYKQLQRDIVESMSIPEGATVKDAMININTTTLGIALVVDKGKRLLGLVTDGDIRRFIIQEEDVHQPITKVMIKKPVTALVGTPFEEIRRLINPRIQHIPLIDEKGVLRDIVMSQDLIAARDESLTIRAKSPLRISFTGGGTDISQYFKRNGGYVLSSSINKYCRGTLKKRADRKIVIHSFDFGITETIEDYSRIEFNGTLDLIKAVIKIMEPSSGFDIYLESDVPPGTGLGSSASIASVVAGLLNHTKEDKMDDYQIAEIIYKAEREEIGISGGWQDQYATVFGGFNFMEFTNKDIILHPLRIHEDILNELRSHLFLCYTGKTRDSGEIQDRLVKKQKERKDNTVMMALARLKEITLESKKALLRGNMEEFGKLLHEGWENKKRCDEGIADSYINYLYDIGIKNGAIGGKLLGAGGGGYLLFFCPPLKKMATIEALKKADAEVMDFDFDDKGLITWAARR